MKRRHQYLDRETGHLVNEKLYGDSIIRFLYSAVREHTPALFRAFTGRRISGMIGFINYDLFLGGKLSGHKRFMKNCGIDLRECLDPLAYLDTATKIFQRKIRYWDCRPMPEEPAAIVSPADARMLIGSLSDDSQFFIKGKFFEYQEILGRNKRHWLEAFDQGTAAIFRLTPEKYHYNHTPVSGTVVDFYEISGAYNSCNPNAVVEMVTPYSKNKRTVTIIDTDVPNGTGVGLVAFIEVVALMIGGIRQCYSVNRYDNPLPVFAGMFLERGVPKSVYVPGSSTDILLFQKGRVQFDADILRNLGHQTARNRFKAVFEQELIETDVKVRSKIGDRQR